jgi:hypothetical protein
MEEDGLADAFRTGSAEGFRAVYERYSGAVYAIALRILGDRELAADAVQVTFLNAWRACGSLEPDRPLAPARRLHALLAEPDSWAEPPAGLLDEILAGIDSERVGLVRPAAGRDGRRRQIHIRRTVRAGATALLAAAAIVIGLVVTRGPATTGVALAGTRLAPGASASAKLHATPCGAARAPSSCGRRSAWPTTPRSPSPGSRRTATPPRPARSCSPTTPDFPENRSRGRGVRLDGCAVRRGRYR